MSIEFSLTVQIKFDTTPYKTIFTHWWIAIGEQKCTYIILANMVNERYFWIGKGSYYLRRTVFTPSWNTVAAKILGECAYCRQTLFSKWPSIESLIVYYKRFGNSAGLFISSEVNTHLLIEVKWLLFLTIYLVLNLNKGLNPKIRYWRLNCIQIKRNLKNNNQVDTGILKSLIESFISFCSWIIFK